MWIAYRWLLRNIRRELYGCRVLELGSGSGRTAKICARILAVSEIVLVDSCVSALASSRARLSNTGISAEFLEADVLEIAFERGFDLVHSEGLLEHFAGAEREAVLRVHAELCRPGGYVLILVPLACRRYYVMRAALRAIRQWHWIETPMTEDELLDGLADNGLELLSTYRSPIFHEIGVLAAKRHP